jgi:hypothetical protein
MTLKTTLARASQAAALLTLASVSLAQTPVFQEVNGLVAIEVESVGATGYWAQETQWTGFTGSSYYRWNGPNQAAGFGTLRYDFEVSQAGLYNLRLRNRHNLPDPTEENDCWVRLNGQGQWVKFYSNLGPSTVNVWTWVCMFEINHQHLNPEYWMPAGRNFIEFSGRSRNFMIDRFHLFQGNHPNGTNQSVPQSPYDNSHTYCVGTPTSAGCVPTISKVGSYASASGASPFVIRATNVPFGTTGALMLGLGSTSTPFLGGTLCVQGSLMRSNPVTATSASGCGGGMLSVPLTTMTGSQGPYLSGVTAHAQFVFRDVGAASRAGLSNALRFTIQN